MKRVYNFNAGPSPMPLEVLEAMKNDLTDFKGTGMGITEISHRSKEFQDMLDETKALLRELMHLDDDYEIVFIQGGGTMQFLMTAYNFLHTRAAYADTGVWAHKARNSAAFFGEAYDANSAADRNYSYIPDTYEVKPGTDYLYLCANNTIYGTEWQYVPETGRVPLACDMSSDILSRPVDVSKYGVIFAGAQKNMAPAGLTVAIVDRSLAGHELPITPIMYSYQRMIDKDSMYNTPPCWNIYILGLVLAWLERQGGVEGMQRLKHARAAKVYDFLDNSALFHACAQPGSRSDMNVTFRTGDDALDKEFISGAAARGLLNLKGHRIAGGMRASLYNAMPMAGVDALVDYLKQFEVEHHV